MDTGCIGSSAHKVSFSCVSSAFMALETGVRSSPLCIMGRSRAPSPIPSYDRGYEMYANRVNPLASASFSVRVLQWIHQRRFFFPPLAWETGTGAAWSRSLM